MIRAAALFAGAALAEIGGVDLIWQTTREGAPGWRGLAGALLLTCYGLLAALQRDPHFGRVLAAYGGVFVATSLLWGAVFDGFRPRPHDLLGAFLCALGAAVIIDGGPG